MIELCSMAESPAFHKKERLLFTKIQTRLFTRLSVASYATCIHKISAKKVVNKDAILPAIREKVLSEVLSGESVCS